MERTRPGGAYGGIGLILTARGMTAWVAICRWPLPLATAVGQAGTLNWLHTHHHGAPILTTNAAGTVVPYPAHAVLGFPGQFANSQQLAGAQHSYNRYRDYDVNTGRYIQADPIGLAGDDNPYAYAGGNPLRFMDPLGLETIWEHYTGLPDSYRVNTINVLAGWSDTYTFGVTYGLRNLIGANKDVDPCNPYYLGSAITGLISPGSFGRKFAEEAGPAGALFGRSRLRNGVPSLFNSGNFRLGWSWNPQGWLGARNYFGVHGGVPKTPSHWHITPIPGPKKGSRW